MFEGQKIAFVGAGAMAEAMIAGLVRDALIAPAEIVASHPRDNRRQALAEKYGVTTTPDNAAAAEQAQVVVLAIKPQVMDQVLAELQPHVAPTDLVISIAAGVTMQRISDALNHTTVVRSMPNTPARIGAGITVWTNAPGVSDHQLAQTRAVLSALGEEVYVEHEHFLDMATALSGTGPAYVFYFMEALVDAGVHLGFSRHIAEKLVTQTLLGSVQFYLHQPNHLARLRNQVTSPGGTTAEALYYLDRAAVRTALSRAVWAAYERSVQLGSGQQRKAPGAGRNGER